MCIEVTDRKPQFNTLYQVNKRMAIFRTDDTKGYWRPRGGVRHTGRNMTGSQQHGLLFNKDSLTDKRDTEWIAWSWRNKNILQTYSSEKHMVYMTFNYG